MTLEELVAKYVQSTQKVFKKIKTTQGSMKIEKEKIENVIQTARQYLEDAKYYRDKGKLETSLAAVAYCEGLLDALRFLGALDFSW
jgi:FAD synthetase